MDWINMTLGDGKEGGIFQITQNTSDATAQLPGSREELMTGEYKQSLAISFQKTTDIKSGFA